MKIEKNNVKVEVNKPEINFDAYELEKAEKKQLNKNKTAIIVSLILTGAASLLSTILKYRKNAKKRKK